MRLFPKFSLNRLRGAGILSEVGEHLFLAPPFTPEVAASVGLISTRLRFRADESSRALCEKEANGMSEREYEAMAPLLAQLARPQKILEIGPGFGMPTVLICTLNKRFEPFPRMQNYSTRVLECRDTKKNAPPLHLLALSKGPIPEVGKPVDAVFPGS